MANGFPVGTRVRLIQPFEIHWVGYVEAGVTGVVVENNPDAEDTVIGAVKLDVEHPLLATDPAWENTLHVYNPDHTDDGTWADWEAI